MTSPKLVQNFGAPVQEVNTDTSGGAGGESTALAFGVNQAEGGNGGFAVGGDGGDSSAKSEGGDVHQGGLLNLNLLSDLEGGDSAALSQAGNGGGASANGGNATAVNETSANSSADGGDGGDADVTATQNTTVVNDFQDSFNEDNDTNTTVTDSYNEDNDVTYIEDSFKSDDDGFDNKGGTIENSVVAGRDIDDSLNSDDDVIIDDSFNEDNSETNFDISDDDITVTEIEDSFNQDNDFLDLDVLNGIDL